MHYLMVVGLVKTHFICVKKKFKVSAFDLSEERIKVLQEKVIEQNLEIKKICYFINI